MNTWDLYCAVNFSELIVLGPKCHSVGCLQPVVARVHWVTGPLQVCPACEARWRDVARALGMTLVVDQISYMPAGLDDAEQRFAMMELS